MRRHVIDKPKSNSTSQPRARSITWACQAEPTLDLRRDREPPQPASGNGCALQSWADIRRLLPKSIGRYWQSQGQVRDEIQHFGSVKGRRIGLGCKQLKVFPKVPVWPSEKEMGLSLLGLCIGI